MSSNGSAVTKKRKPQTGGGFFSRRPVEYEPFRWQMVDGELLRMVLDGLTSRGQGLAFFVAPGGRGMKVRLYAEGPPSDQIVLTAGEMNSLLSWLIDELAAADENLRVLFEDVSTWLETREG